MNLRRSRFDDHWRHVLNGNSPTRVDSVTFNRLSCLTNDTIHFRSGINAIVGANGVGKSTLLAAIGELLLGEPVRGAVGHGTRLSGSSLEAETVWRGARTIVSINGDGSGERPAPAPKFAGPARWLEPSYLATELCNAIDRDQNFYDNLESVTPLELDADELAIASYVVGKQYTACEIFEIIEYGDFERMPYFRVTSDGVAYGTESMGQGELSLMLLYWTLRDLPKQSILILEEPETHVSPRSQSALMDILAKFCDEKKLWIVITTHSPAVIQRIPRENLRLIAMGAGTAILITNPTNTQVASLLGGGVAFRGAFLVEDVFGKDFLLALLQEFDPDLASQFEIVLAGSEGAISGALESMPPTKQWLRIVGVYDGDMRGQIETEAHRWPSAFLPGDSSPEELLIGALSSLTSGHADLGGLLNRTTEAVTAAINAARGLDPHDWGTEVARVLSVERSALIKALLRLWLNQDGNRETVASFCSELRQLIDR